MIDKEKLDRINELARKKKTEGLTKEEQAERKALHEEYLQAVRDSLRVQLESIEFVDDDQDLTEEEKENIAFLNDKLGKEFNEQKKKQLTQTLEGNPGNPQGKAGKEMLQRMNKSHRTETDWGLDKLHIHPKTILDIGCGGGAAIANLLQRYPDAQITGVDISETAIEESINLNREAVINDQVRIHLDNVENLSLGNEMFDLVVTINSYFFWSDFTKALKEIKRVLNKNGTVLLLGDAYKGYQLSEDVKQINQIYQLKLLSPEEMKSAFEKEGFKNIQVDTDNKNHWICVVAQK